MLNKPHLEIISRTAAFAMGFGLSWSSGRSVAGPAERRNVLPLWLGIATCGTSEARKPGSGADPRSKRASSALVGLLFDPLRSSPGATPPFGATLSLS